MKTRWNWKDGLVAAYDMIQSHEKGEEAGYKAAYHTLYGTEEIDGKCFREGWADALENWKYRRGEL